jgi:hypothetical protein
MSASSGKLERLFQDLYCQKALPVSAIQSARLGEGNLMSKVRNEEIRNLTGMALQTAIGASAAGGNGR